MRLQGKRNRGKEEVKFLEIKGDDQLSGAQQWLTKNMTEEKQNHQSYSKVTGTRHRFPVLEDSRENGRRSVVCTLLIPAEKRTHAHGTTKTQASDNVFNPPSECYSFPISGERCPRTRLLLLKPVVPVSSLFLTQQIPPKYEYSLPHSKDLLASVTALLFSVQAKERELELKNTWAENRLTRRQTQAKYGF